MARQPDPELAERRRRQILEAALHCFRRRGFHQATMQEICSEAGISPGALYRYFPSKADIIAAIAQDERRETDMLLAAGVEDRGLIEALCEVARRVLARRGNDDHTSIYADVIAEAARDKLLARKLADIDTASVSRLAAVLEAAQKRHEIDERLDTLAAARTLIATLEGIGLRYVMKPHEETCEACDMEISDFRALAERYLGSSL